MNKHNVSGVRGNHDQQVIEWRSWLDWIHTLEGGAGSRWLEELEQKWEEDNQGGELEDDSHTKAWVGTQRGKGQKDSKWWSRVPKGWKLFSDHYRIARLVPFSLIDNWEYSNERSRAMSVSDYEYLLSLPLILHLPSEHTFLVHAGLLPYDPTLSITSKRQPLSHLPRIRSRLLGGSIPALRNAQELAILEDIKQNTDPWVLLNIRNLRKDNKPSRLVTDLSIPDASIEPQVDLNRKTNKGKAWADVWNEIISRCVGFERGALGAERTLPCHPSTVVYGHTASRGLDVHRWSVGIDTGCVRCSSLSPLSFLTILSSRPTAGGLRHSFWITRTHTWEPIPLAPTKTILATMMGTTSSQGQGLFLSVTADRRSFSVSSVTRTSRRSIMVVIPHSLFPRSFSVGRAVL
jgi:hypothetical protein